MKIPIDFICEWDSSLGLQLACQVCFPAAPCLWWHPPSCLPTGLGLPCAAQVAFIHPLLYFLLAEARWALTSRACECTVPCNPIGHVHCACYRLGPVYSTGLCFRSRRLMRRDMVQRAVLWESPVLLCFTQGIALAPWCWFGGCSEHTWVATVAVLAQGVQVQSGILVCWADSTALKGYNIFTFGFPSPHSHPLPALLCGFRCQGFKELLQVMVSYTLKVGKNCLLRKDLREK